MEDFCSGLPAGTTAKSEEDLVFGQVQAVTGSQCHVVETAVGLAAVVFKGQGKVLNARGRNPGSIACEHVREEEAGNYPQQMSLFHRNVQTRGEKEPERVTHPGVNSFTSRRTPCATHR